MNTYDILGGWGDVTLYDASNGYLNVGYVENVRLRSRSQSNTTIGGLLRKYNTEYELSCDSLNTSQEQIDAIEAREGTKQTIYLVGANHYTVISNVYIASEFNRRYGGNAHVITIEASTNDTSDITTYQNIFGTQGNFESSSGGLGSGWAQTSLTSYSIQTSHLSGGGDAQYLTMSNTGTRRIYYDKTIAFEDTFVLVFSAYIQTAPMAITLSGTYTMGIELLEDSTVKYKATKNITYSGVISTRQFVKCRFPGSKFVNKVRAYIGNDAGVASELQFDNAQFEFGKMTGYKEY